MKDQTIAIDFDHTIWLNEENRPQDGVHEAFDAFRMKGYKIIIHSCNNPKWIREMCEKWNLRPDWIWGEVPDMDYGKPVATVYIDDRAIRHEGDWAQTLERALADAASRPVRSDWRAR